ncbi:microsomal glutathione S-transferase 2-like [Diadema setosum]|uniref:microsomal glutathione S-transferase 2-like n=1 Tax=Diadema setosum TaxID=31175 RepID=UPI003B3B4025
MSQVRLQDLLFPTAASLLHAWQLASFARQVGKARMKYKVPYPKIEGDEDFMRYYRAQQNCVEFTPIFFPVLWAAGLFFHPVAAGLAGLVYVYGRYQYFNGYIKEVKGRLYGFGVSVNAIKALLLMSVTGMTHLALVTYANIDCKQMIMDRLNL